MNRAEIRGSLTRDPTLREVGQYATTLLEMSVAVNGARYDASTRSQVVTTIYVSVQVWGTLADEVWVNGPLSQGDEVHIVGELDQREVEKPDGKKDRKTRINALYVGVLRRRHSLTAGATAQQGQSSQPPF